MITEAVQADKLRDSEREGWTMTPAARQHGTVTVEDNLDYPEHLAPFMPKFPVFEWLRNFVVCKI